MAPLRAGLLDRKILLERRFEEVDSSGQAHLVWFPIAMVWARVEPLGGRENFGAQQFVATGDLRFTIRWRSDVTPLHRVTYESVPYDVVSVAEEGRREALLIVARGRAEQRP